MDDAEAHKFVKGKFDNLRSWAIEQWGAQRCEAYNSDISQLIDSWDTLLVATCDIFQPAHQQGKLRGLIAEQFHQRAGICLTPPQLEHIHSYFVMLVDVIA
jgi:hypothetical protein